MVMLRVIEGTEKMGHVKGSSGTRVWEVHFSIMQAGKVQRVVENLSVP